jgi:riboflavin synthase
LPFLSPQYRTTTMFSGIVEATAQVLFIEKRENVVRVILSRPLHFNDLQTGDSISCNGVCLTIEKFDDKTIQFSLANETLKLLQIDSEKLLGQVWNLERSLRFGDRVHGHLVTGHVETLGEVVRSEALGESWLLDVKVPESTKRYIWKKGSVALQGVSLTVNEFVNNTLSVCLIPETLKRTNLADLKVGQRINIETDYLAKAYFQERDHEL